MKKTLQLLCLLTLLCPLSKAQNTGIGTLNPTDQLHTTGSVRFQNYSGTGTRLMYIDSAGKLTQPTPPGTVFSNNTAYTITDNGCSSNSGATSIINVSGQPASVASSNIAVRLNITHLNDVELTLYLFAPNGNILLLASGQGGAGQNYSGTIFTDASPLYISSGTAPFSGRYTPQGAIFSQCLLTGTVGSFGAIGGGSISPNGAWVLKAFDNAGGFQGTLNNWQITFDGQEAFGTTGATGPVPYFHNGALTLSPISVVGGNVGINNTSPLFALDIAGGLHTSGGIVMGGTLTAGNGINSTGAIQFTTGIPAAGKVLTATNVYGNADWQTPGYSGSGFLALVALTTVVPTGTTGITVPYTLTSGPGLSGSSFNDGGFNFGTNSYIAPSAGVYHFEASVGLNGAAPANTTLTLTVMKTSGGTTTSQQKYSQAIPTATIPQTMEISFQLKLLANDVVYLNFTQNSGANLSITGVLNTSYFSGHRVY